MTEMVSSYFGGGGSALTPGLGGASQAMSLITSQLKLEQAYLIITPTAASSVAGDVLGGAIGAAALAGGPQALPGPAGDTASSVADQTGSGLSTASATLGGSVGGKISFLYNPEEFSIGGGANWTTNPTDGKTGETPQFKYSKLRSLDVTVFLDASYSQSGNVHDDVLLLLETTKPTLASLLADAPCPPAVIFGWGSNVTFPCFMESVTAKYILFRPNGTPLRAECSLKMKEVPQPLPLQNPTSGSRETRRTRTTIAGDTLQSVATNEYRKPTMWRALAEANGIDDPLRVPPGTSLLVPPPLDAAELA